MAISRSGQRAIARHEARMGERAARQEGDTQKEQEIRKQATQESKRIYHDRSSRSDTQKKQETNDFIGRLNDTLMRGGQSRDTSDGADYLRSSYSSFEATARAHLGLQPQVVETSLKDQANNFLQGAKDLITGGNYGYSPEQIKSGQVQSMSDWWKSLAKPETWLAGPKAAAGMVAGAQNLAQMGMDYITGVTPEERAKYNQDNPNPIEQFAKPSSPEQVALIQQSNVASNLMGTGIGGIEDITQAITKVAPVIAKLDDAGQIVSHLSNIGFSKNVAEKLAPKLQKITDAKAVESILKNELPKSTLPLQEEGKITLYHGSNKALDRNNLDYGTFLTSSKQEALDYAKMRSKGGTPKITKLEFSPNEVRLNETTGEYQYIGASKSLQGKYPQEVYKAYNDVNGSNLTAKEIDKLSLEDVRGNASMGLTGGTKEFDSLVPPLQEGGTGGKIASEAGAGDFNKIIDTQNRRLQYINEARKAKVADNIVVEDSTYNKIKNTLLNRFKATKESGVDIPGSELTPKQEQALVAKEARNARLNMFEVESRLKARKATLDYKLNKLLGKNTNENTLAKQLLQEPERANEILAQSKNPQKIIDAAKAYKEYTDAAYKLRDLSGSEKIGYLTNYLHTGWDLSNAEDLARYRELESRLMKNLPENYRGGYARPKVFKTETEGIQAGFKPKFETLQKSADDLHGQLLRTLPNDALVNTIKKSPIADHLATTDFYGAKKPSIPGLEGTYVSPQLAKELKALEPSVLMQTPIIKQILRTGRNVKDLLLSLSNFHALNISKKVLGATGNPWEIGKGVGAYLSPKYYNSQLDKAIEEGVVDYMSKAGYNTFSYQGLGGDIVSKGKYNPINIIHQATFDRMISLYNMDLARAAMKKGIEPGSEVGRNLAEQVNALLGSINYKTMRGNILSNPEVKALGDGLMLAPGFSGGKIKNLKAALNITKWDPASNFARRAVIGDVIVSALIVELGQKVVTGKFHDPNDVLQKDLFDPQISLPWKSQSGRDMKASLPGTDVSDVLKVFQDPTHALISRGSPLVSATTQLVSNRDYYGNPLASWDSKNPTLDKLKSLGQNYLPIGVQQGLKYGEGKQNLGSTLTNIAGFRAGTDMSQAEKDARTSWSKMIPGNKTQEQIDQIVQQNADLGKKPLQLSPEDWKKQSDFLNSLAKTEDGSPERTKVIQNYIDTIPDDQRKSVKYKLMLASVSTKGVSFSQDIIDIKDKFNQYLDLRKQGKLDEASKFEQGLSDSDYTKFQKAQSTWQASNTKVFDKPFKDKNVDEMFNSLKSFDTDEQNRIIKSYAQKFRSKGNEKYSDDQINAFNQAVDKLDAENAKQKAVSMGMSDEYAQNEGKLAVMSNQEKRLEGQMQDSGTPVAEASFQMGTSGSRPDRMNNPLAAAMKSGQPNQFTAALDKAGVKWSEGDAFPNDPSMHTIKIEGDPLKASIAILSDSNAFETWYKNHTGKQAASQFNIQNADDFKKLSQTDQVKVVASIYAAENGDAQGNAPQFALSPQEAQLATAVGQGKISEAQATQTLVTDYSQKSAQTSAEIASTQSAINSITAGYANSGYEMTRTSAWLANRAFQNFNKPGAVQSFYNTMYGLKQMYGLDDSTYEGLYTQPASSNPLLSGISQLI